MQKETRQQLRELLEQQDRAYLQTLEGQGEWVVEEEKIDHEFERIREHAIQPVMEEFHDLMDEHGLKSRIAVQHRLVRSDGKTEPAKIAFEYLVLTNSDVHGLTKTTPTLTFISEPGLGKVLVYENAILPFIGGHVGVIEELPLAEVTGDLVEKHLLALSKKIFTSMRERYWDTVMV